MLTGVRFFSFRMIILNLEICLILCGCSTSQDPSVYVKSYVGLRKDEVLFFWSKHCFARGEPFWNISWQQLWLYDKEERTDENYVKYGDGLVLSLPSAITDDSLRWYVQGVMKQQRIQESVRWDAFEIHDPDLNLLDFLNFSKKNRRMAVWFDKNAFVTNQCVIVYRYYDG